MGPRRERWLERFVWLGAAVVVAALAWQRPALPDPWLVATFALLTACSENVAVRLPGPVGVSASSPWVLATLTAVGGGGEVLAAVLVGAAGGLIVEQFRRRRFRLVAYNAAQYVLAAAAAGVVCRAAGQLTGNRLVAALPAVAVFTAVNAALILWVVTMEQDAPVGDVWSDMAPAVPNYVAFTLLGVVVGVLAYELGALALLLLAVPVAIARTAYLSSLELGEAREAAVALFLAALQAKDAYTAGHVRRVAHYSRLIGEQLGLRAVDLERLHQSALLHDVGKLAVDRSLLTKPSQLTAEEFAQMQRHAEVCVDILAGVDLLAPLGGAASGHHARFDGGGYGRGPSSTEAAVVAVADAFDAMTSTRAYRRALSQEVAFAELRAKAGTQLDPLCVEALIGALDATGERHGLGHEDDAVAYAVEPPERGLGSAGLGDLLAGPAADIDVRPPGRTGDLVPRAGAGG